MYTLSRCNWLKFAHAARHARTEYMIAPIDRCNACSYVTRGVDPLKSPEPARVLAVTLVDQSFIRQIKVNII